MSEFNNAVAIVTGSGGGIGKAISERLAAGDAKVAIADINFANAEALAAKINDGGGVAAAFKVDVTSSASTKELAAAVESELGPIAILVNNAGVSKRMPFLQLEEEEWDRVMNINLKGQFLMLKAVLPYMVKRNYGRVVNMASIVGKFGPPDFAHYVVSKTGVLGLTRAVASEFVRTGITVNSVLPGIVETPLHDGILKEMAEGANVSVDVAMDRFLENIPQGRAQEPEDIANMVAFLVNEAARNMTGGSYHVDGGAVMT